MNKLFCILVLVLFVQNIEAQNITGARASALASANVAMVDAWSPFSNPAGISTFSKTQLAFSNENSALIKSISNKAFALVYPTSLINTGMYFQSFGLGNNQIQQLTSSFARHFDKKLSLGLNVNYHIVNIQNYALSSAFSTDFGMQYQIVKRLSLGLSINNFGLTKINGDNLVNLFSGFKIGSLWLVSDNVNLYTQYEKSFNTTDASLRIGIAYMLTNEFECRMGIKTSETTYFAGLGYQYNHWKLDISSSFQQLLGGAWQYYPQASVLYEF